MADRAETVSQLARPSPRMKKYMRQVRTHERGGAGHRDGGGKCGIVSEENEVRFGWPAIWGTHDDLGDPDEEHVWNRLPDGSILDATRDQFGDRAGRCVRIIRPQDPEYARYRTGTGPVAAQAPGGSMAPQARLPPAAAAGRPADFPAPVPPVPGKGRPGKRQSRPAPETPFPARLRPP
jgi:hypothetical protein